MVTVVEAVVAVVGERGESTVIVVVGKLEGRLQELELVAFKAGEYTPEMVYVWVGFC